MVESFANIVEGNAAEYIEAGGVIQTKDRISLTGNI